MEPTDVHPLFGEVSQAMGPFFGPYQEKLAETGLEPQEWGTLAVAHDFEPGTASVARFQVRNPYANPQPIQEQLDKLVEKGMFEPAGGGEYRITDAGHRVVKTMNATLADVLRPLEPLPAADLERIAGLLRRLIDAIAAAPEPATPAFTANRSSDPGPQGPVMLRMLQYFADFNAFRDDAHLAAWRPVSVSGPAWEAMTFIWRGEVHTPAELAEKLTNRRWTPDDYAAALREVAGRGWVIEQDGAYLMTDAGTNLRQEIEDQTDRYYYAPGRCSAPPRWCAGSLLIRLRDRLNGCSPLPSRRESSRKGRSVENGSVGPGCRRAVQRPGSLPEGP
jgi:hypothetical protein